MSYQSIDALQNVLKETVFSHAKDAKKAAGRALGTMVELITCYLLREWGLCDYMSIERGLPEYGDKEITHNVEFSLHPILRTARLDVPRTVPITSAKILSALDGTWASSYIKKKSCSLLDTCNTLRNSCLLAEGSGTLLVANMHGDGIHVALQQNTPFAMVECKRVGVEDGCKRGPQTIEKAKQGAYVAQMTSSLQEVWVGGHRYGLICKGGTPVLKPYNQLLDEVMAEESLPEDFILSIGVVSNHGNWFTAENKNKEMKVLANSFDWLLFLTDTGLAEFITELLLRPKSQYAAVREAFVTSYKEGKKANVFTKTKIDKDAHEALCRFFHKDIAKVEGWFNVVSPEEGDIAVLRSSLLGLTSKRKEVSG